jgi:GNAT superfamily N-acetyltransferase
MPDVRLRAMDSKDWSEVADLIYVSLNYWCEANGRPPLFHGGPETTEVFCRVYEELDPGHCVVAEHPRTGRLTGSCFYRERETHVSLGIMNVHPAYFGEGVGKALLEFICDFTDRLGKPLRLVSSAMNLDSFSLYTRAGFVPRLAYQDMLLSVPEDGLSHDVAGIGRVRLAQASDLDAVAALELELSGISRAKDYRYFAGDTSGLWRMVVLEGERGGVDGYLASIGHARFNMLGPGVARTQEQALALLAAQLDAYRGRTPLFLVPCDASDLVRELYSWGARNCELHFAQVRGASQPFAGVSFATFMPETG